MGLVFSVELLSDVAHLTTFELADSDRLPSRDDPVDKLLEGAPFLCASERPPGHVLRRALIVERDMTEQIFAAAFANIGRLLRLPLALRLRIVDAEVQFASQTKRCFVKEPIQFLETMGSEGNLLESGQKQQIESA